MAAAGGNPQELVNGVAGGGGAPRLVMQETIFRYFHLQKPGLGAPPGLLYAPNGIQINSSEDDNLVEEVISSVTGQVHWLKVRVLNDPRVPFNPSTYQYYKTVNRFDLSYPAPTNWVFECFSCLPALKVVRFAPGFFGSCKEEPNRKLEKSPNVKELIISFDLKKFQRQGKSEQQQIKNKLDVLLSMVPIYLPGLTALDINLPEAPTLDLFLEKVPHLKRGGQKTENFKEGIFGFRTTNASSSSGPSNGHHHAHKKSGSPPRHDKNSKRPSHNGHASGPSPSNGAKKVKQERTAPLQPVDPEPLIVDISGDDLEEIPPASASTTPPQPGDDQLSPMNGFLNHSRFNKKNGRGSPSLLGDH